MKGKRRRSRNRTGNSKSPSKPKPAFTAAEEAFFRAGLELEQAPDAHADEAPPERPSWLRRLFSRAA